ncbi:MAG: M1 family metallopeptidase [Melioribacteraceae bacterium]|nr:M1 family metallopeptidase [Melioribacteraceae bacterium]
MKSNILSIAVIIILINSRAAFPQTGIYDTGGILMPEQAAYDVTYYDLSLFVNPSDSSIDGSVLIEANVLSPIEEFVIDLDTLLTIHNIVEMDEKSRNSNIGFTRKIGKVRIMLSSLYDKGSTLRVKIFYGGRPLIAKHPPWLGGFQWAKTRDGSPWIATSCQGEGSDIWYPSKDHVSDEPDSMGIHIRVPDPLFCASNGRLLSEEKHNDSTTTYHWFVSTPINNYNVALNIAPYKLIEDTYTSVSGDTFPVQFYVLPEHLEKGVEFFPEIIEHLEFYEKHLGPYPFRADKYGVVQTPHLGMEHQTIIAYGASFNNAAMTGKDWGFDALHHHELSHEWWGNLVTNSDWRDMWLHEGFGTYMQALYLEETQGIEKYHDYIKANRNFSNTLPVAPRDSKTEKEITDAPVYQKGAWFLHMLRYFVGEKTFRKILRSMAYPDPELEKISDGSQTRFATTDDFLAIAEKISGKELEWLFEIYLRQTKLPELYLEPENGNLFIKWQTPNGLNFPMPLEIKLGDELNRINIPNEGINIKIVDGNKIDIDPEHWILFEPAALETAIHQINNRNYIGARESVKLITIACGDSIAEKNLLRHINFLEITREEVVKNNIKKVVGDYLLFGNYKFTVSENDDGLFMSGVGNRHTRIFPISDSEFVTTNSEQTVEFIIDASGRVTELQLGRISAKRVNNDSQ